MGGLATHAVRGRQPGPRVGLREAALSSGPIHLFASGASARLRGDDEDASASLSPPAKLTIYLPSSCAIRIARYARRQLPSDTEPVLFSPLFVLRFQLGIRRRNRITVEAASMKVVLILFASVAMLSAGGCAGVGKGKGKAPPPVAAPIVTKG